MDYPEELIRGIPNKDDMAEDYPDSSLFKRFDVPEEKRDTFQTLENLSL